ncbi:uncharacterized protein E0L32_003267 [Thyridium curvatum]|uniref:Zn(2)-C6 fungal-type domain-containing protein n=1 Tax=Thyridium curvatum TaxID=1093900 RepID=A0A507BIC3_9PEZI|nr:uncharacterized protein E0L32_003267 [Thyridium curvatum]TPX17149.1 hypothetical protein E0L32_003267 [Thyridium curvatum]
MSSTKRDGERALKPLSCTTCRQRKVKCDKVHPACAPCRRIGVPCVFPDRKRHRKPRNNRQTELLNRLSRLEGIVGTFDPGALGSVDQELGPGPGGATLPPATAGAAVPAGPEAPDNPEELKAVPLRPEPSRGSVDKYLSPVFWSTLCSEVEGLKQTLEQPSDDEESEGEDADETSPESSERSPPAPLTATSYGMFGNPASATQGLLTQPSPEHISYLCSTYFTNVDLVLKIIHKPTIVREIERFVKSGRAQFTSTLPECLLFAMYFGAAVSSRNQACLDNLGEPQHVLAERFRLATEIALAKADYLNTTDLEVIQALTIYVGCLRAHSGCRASWALLALAVRLARALGLHSDGDGSSFPPYVAELRRRVWWQLVVIDIRAVEDRGTEPLINTDSFDTILPTNIDDADFGPDDHAPIVGREGPTDTSMSLCSAMSSGFFIHLNDPGARFANASSEEEILAQIQRLESLFIGPSTDDPAHMPSFLAARTVRIIILKFWLFLQYPFQARLAATRPSVPRENVLRTAVAVLELSEVIRTCSGAEHHEWWTETYVQWHPLAVALAELCEQTRGELVDRAWRIIDKVFPMWRDRIADAKRGTLWKPIRKLLKRAREARARAQEQPQAGHGQQQPAAGEASSALAGGDSAEIDLPRAYNAQLNLDRSPPIAADSPSLVLPDFNQFPQFASSFFNQDAGQDLNDPVMDWTTWTEFVQDAYDANTDAQDIMPSSWVL